MPAQDPRFDGTLVAAICHQLGVDVVRATRLATAATPLWSELERAGMVDTFGGAECERVLPAALAFIRESANQVPSP